MNVRRLVILRLCWAIGSIAAAPVASAEDLPVRPVKIIVQTAAGSSLDVMARLIAEPLSQIWKQQAVVMLKMLVLVLNVEVAERNEAEPLTLSELPTVSPPRKSPSRAWRLLRTASEPVSMPPS